MDEFSLDIFNANIGSGAEAARMAAVRRYDILDTPPDGSFDRITAIAARLFNVPIAIVSIVDHDRIWFKSHHGLPIQQISREAGLCASAVLSQLPRIVTDARLDAAALANPLVAGEFGLRFYAGVPLQTFDGHNLGTLCVIDLAPRPVTQAQIDDLTDLAAVVMDQLELRLSARQAIAREQLLAKEIDHRVMNSLQFIASMLSMQSLAPQSADAKEELQLAANRVAAVAQVHRNFYAHAAGEVDCLAFLRRLCADMASISGHVIEISGDEDSVPTTLIQPIGLIANEIITNAAKYGAGRVEVFYHRQNNQRRLRICNDGAALPENFNPARTGGLGMRVITALIAQLHGELVTGPYGTAGGGACFTVTFPV